MKKSFILCILFLSISFTHTQNPDSTPNKKQPITQSTFFVRSTIILTIGIIICIREWWKEREEHRAADGRYFKLRHETDPAQETIKDLQQQLSDTGQATQEIVGAKNSEINSLQEDNTALKNRITFLSKALLKLQSKSDSSNEYSNLEDSQASRKQAVNEKLLKAFIDNFELYQKDPGQFLETLSRCFFSTPLSQSVIEPSK